MSGDDRIALTPLKEAKREFERVYIQLVLVLCNGSVAEAAKMLGTNRTYLYGRVRRLGVVYTRRTRANWGMFGL